MENQTGKTALITGASSGIGRELARLFAKDGYKLVVVGRNTELLEQLSNTHKNQYGTETVIIEKDLADPNAPDEIYAETQSKGIYVDVLVNDAGFGEYGEFATQTDLQKELNVVQVNAVALMHLTKLYVKDMVARQDGKILMLGSEVSVVPNPMMAVYGATKAFIKSFSEAIRNELKGTNVTVTVLMPGATNTNFFNAAGASDIKGADPAKTANPADVAKEGYEALMAGKDHVVAGWMNKARVAMAHVLPDPLIAANARKDMEPKSDSADQKERSKQFAVGLGIVAGLVAGLYLTYRQANPYDRMRYRYKAAKVGKSTRNILDAATDSVKGAYQKAKEVAEEQFA
ncbi:hypothetical protein GCM10027592_00950 [Spirosoma flavus]